MSKPQFRRAIDCIVLMSLVLLPLYAGNLPSVHAQGTNAETPTAAPQSREVILVPGTVAVGDEIQKAVIVALENAADLSPNTIYFAITDLRLEGSWALASVIGLAQVHAGLVWSIEDGSWIGLVILKQGQDGKWEGGTQGTPRFSSLIDEAPDTFLDGRAKQNLDPLRQPATQQPSIQTAGTYSFPWQPGTAMFYGSSGVHDNGFSSIVSGWKAVDMMSDGNTGAGHAPNRLLTAEAGTISYKCTDSNNVAIRLGDFFYTHLVDNSSLVTGSSFAQGAELGQMKVGSFGNAGSGCGWASQPGGWFHVHWGFPNANLQVEDWTLSMSTQNWTNGSTTVSPGNGWITAGSTDPCLAPSLSTPADGAISTTQTITFSWSALSGCIFNGYTFRVKTVSTMDSGGTTIVDTANSLASRTQTIPSQWNNQDLYWGVKAANAPFGASWSVGRFSIQPGNAVPTDYGYCSDEGQRCAFSGTAQIYYGANDHFVGPLTFTDGVDCNSDVFGDPIPGTTKQCFINGGRPEGSTWCANEGGACDFGVSNVATVHYGVNGQYNNLTGVVTSIACNTSTFGDPFPWLEKSCYYDITGSTAATSTIFSNATLDGFIVESSETSGVGGTMNSTATTFKLGDGVANRQYRAILSFGTGVLPDTAVVTSVTLKIRRAGLAGTNPFGTLGNVVVDIRKGAFNNNTALELADFRAASSRNAALTITNSPVRGWYSGVLSSANFIYINKIGLTQFRLRFAKDDNNNSVADYLKFYSGNYVPATTDYRPVLVIQYYIP